VEVTVAADTLIATSSSSVGNVLPEYKVRDLPLGARNVLDLILTSSGVSNAVNTAGQAYGAFEGDTGVLAGGRLSAVNTTRDGFKQTFVGAVLTPQARQGIFRFFPGADNQNAIGSNPSVVRSGNPVRPAGATGDLQSFNIFADASGRPRDPLRPGADPTGLIS